MEKQLPFSFPEESKYETNSFHEGDILLFNTFTDKNMPSDYVGRYHIHIFCNAGKAQFRMAERIFEIHANDFVIWQIGSDIYDVLYSADFDADFLMVSRTFLIENNPEKVWATKGYIYIKQNPVFPLEENESILIKSDFHRFRKQLAGKLHIFRREILGRLMQIFLFDLWNVYAREITKQENLSNLSAGLFHRFMDLLRQYSAENREVAFYAEKLCVTPKYLSEVVAKGSGKPASYWINGYATQEIIALLKNPDVTLTEIADRMHFYNLSHFSRFVKRMLGVSPSEYRNELEKRNK